MVFVFDYRHNNKFKIKNLKLVLFVIPAKVEDAQQGAGIHVLHCHSEASVLLFVILREARVADRRISGNGILCYAQNDNLDLSGGVRI
ncbi:MAG: hypothetical protein COU83_03065 [Candidatus Portnoybacteria bacterium CG10_big_fil_rev_8_21_14_0_10_40_22]|uniref:Uncharacterized protein n=1 Tax=Candidatus Portnoybacteria bacterium CG10_big_fil_rev_8_21_14_0_10_40_22 TaxID=1974814 RepID=A0A2M8KF96_9BACT|nr:MAG: hypothetical protein COU83_03065 [Candidatus Portnoybacteria bacterium CG10_big_fil_rev_8_21_14_0_10_40_22]